LKRKTLLIITLITAILMSTTTAQAKLKIVEALGEYPRPVEIEKQAVDKLKIDFTRATESIMKHQPVIVAICITNVPAGTTASYQWKQDQTLLSDGYCSSVELHEGIKLLYQGILPNYSPTGSTRVGLDIAVDGVMREIMITIPYKDGVYYDNEVQRILELVQPMKVPATVTSTCTTYSDKTLNKKVGTLAAGTTVYYFDHYMVVDKVLQDGTIVEKDYSSYIQLPDGSYVWVSPKNIRISKENHTQSGDYTQYEKETFVNAKGYSSETDYLIWVSPVRQKVNIFMGIQNNWSLIKSFTCATGANSTPTPVGTYKYVARDDAWIKPTYQVRPILYFELYRGLAFHSRLYSPDGSYLTDSTIGRPVSHGCIRMLDDDIRWMELMIPRQTTVIVY